MTDQGSAGLWDRLLSTMKGKNDPGGHQLELISRHLPPEYAKAVCKLFAQRGVSDLVPSGDSGVGSGNCGDGSGNNDFIPEFPSTCPFITNVGGTTFETYKDQEVAASFSGGGFSDYFPRQRYQDRAVSEFLQNLGGKYASLYNSAGRAYPDIAKQALRSDVIVGNAEIILTGAGCSTSTVAGIISLLNDYRISNGKPPLGFLNMWLYGDGLAGLNDITSGSNPGYNTDGFSAIVGWDPATGLGTPNFQRLQSIFIID